MNARNASKDQTGLCKAIAARGPLTREIAISRAAIDESARTVELAFASDKPIEHWFGLLSLSMRPGAMRSARLDSGAAVLLNHDPEKQIGVIESYRIGNDGIARAVVRFSRSQLAEEIFQDILDGIRRSVSVGFLIHEIHLEREADGEPPLYQSDDWEPYEVSIVSVPADISVGVGRSADDAVNQPIKREDTTMPLDKVTNEPALPPAHADDATGHTQSPQAARNARIRELVEWASIFGDEAAGIARAVLLENPTATQEEIRTAIASRLRTPQPTGDAAFTAPNDRPRIVGYESAGYTEIDLSRGEMTDSYGWGLTREQLSAISTKAYRDAFSAYIRKRGERNLSAGELRALQAGVDSAGGFLVPAEFIARMVERLPAETAVQNFVTQINTSSDQVIMPKNTYSASNLYTTGVRVTWVEETVGVSPSTGAENFGSVKIPVHTAMLQHDISRNMIEDSSFDILAWLQSKFRETIDVMIEDSIIRGDGIGKPFGILANPGGANQPAVVNSGNASALTADGLIDLAWSLLSRYRRNARFVYNSTSSGRAIAKLKDSANRYLFATGINTDGLASARPTSLLGFPVIESDFMPDVAANAFPIIFGDLSGYYLVNRIGFSIQVLEEVKAAQNLVSVLGRVRIGGQVAEEWKINVHKVAV